VRRVGHNQFFVGYVWAERSRPGDGGRGRALASPPMRIHPRAAGAAVVALALVAVGCLAGRTSGAPAGAGEGRAAFALIGDMQYSDAQQAPFERVMAELDSSALDFVVHVGDIHGGSEPCTDSIQRARRDEYDRSRHPFVLVFGDNEWTDCHRTGFDPEERLRALRSHFASGSESLGRRRMRLVRQSDAPWGSEYAEHARWEAGGALFVTLNVVGSNNAYARTPEAARERDRRTDAAIEWMRESFRHARERGLAGVMVVIHGDPGFRRERLAPGWLTNLTGFDRLLGELGRLTVDFAKPVVLVHGDTHTFVVDMPLSDSATGQLVANFTRVEVFGSPDAHWVRGTADAGDPRVFRFEPMLVPANVVGPRGTPVPH
jgi:hypothetical protein